MTTVNPRLIYATDLQSYFVDKDTGLPLAEGVVTFYRNSSRTILKPVYELTGTPGNPVYTPLPNPMTLSGVGTPQDAMGNDILILYYPYVGAPDDEDADDAAVDLYYITVDAKAIPPATEGVRQFTREFFPNLSDGAVATSIDQFNYIPNGQFLVHNNLPADPLGSPAYDAGEIREDVTIIAPGGWTFERSPGATTKDFVTFPAFDGYTVNPTGSPKFACNIQCTQTGTNSIKYLGIKWFDVNQFSSEDSQTYNFYIEGKVETGTLSVQLYLRKNFGSGGSSEVLTALEPPILLTSTYQAFNTEVIFGENTIYEIGDGSYVQIVAALPPTAIFNASFDNAALTVSSDTLTQFPQQTEADTLTRSVAGWMPVPDPDGFDLYLSPVQTKDGMAWDDSEIGFIYPAAFINPTGPFLKCNAARYRTDGYSDLGIPYARLQAKIYDESTEIPFFGTGIDFVTAYVEYDSTTRLQIVTNQSGSVTAATAGTTSFGINTALTGTAGYGVTAYDNGASILVIGDETGLAHSTAGAGDASMTVDQLRSSSLTQQIFEISGSFATGTALREKYFLFSNTTTDYFMWFKVDGAGSIPTPPGSPTAILVDLSSTWAPDDIRFAIMTALNGEQITVVVPVAASSITSGQYFTFNTLTEAFFVYYIKDSSGSEPSVPGKIAIRCDILSADTAALVTSKTIRAINSAYFAVPSSEDIVLKGYNNGNEEDPNSIRRYSKQRGMGGIKVGSLQYSDVVRHLHGISYAEENPKGGQEEDVLQTTTPPATLYVGADLFPLPPETDLEGVAQTYVNNLYVQYFIKY